MEQTLVSVMMYTYYAVLLVALPAGAVATLGYPRIRPEMVVRWASTYMLVAPIVVVGVLLYPKLPYLPGMRSLAVALCPLVIASYVQMEMQHRRDAREDRECQEGRKPPIV